MQAYFLAYLAASVDFTQSRDLNRNILAGQLIISVFPPLHGGDSCTWFLPEIMLCEPQPWKKYDRARTKNKTI